MPAFTFAIIAALPDEAAAWRSSCADTSAPVVHCGIGAERAAAAAHDAVRRGAAALLAFGTAGGLDATLPAGTLVLPPLIENAGHDRFAADPAWHAEAAARLASLGPAIAPLCSSSSVVATVAAKAALRSETSAGAVDMESAAVAAVAAQHGCPFLALRAIVDPAQFALPAPALGALRDDGSIALGRLVRAVLAAPGCVGELLRLRDYHRRAMTSLRRAAALLTANT